MKKNPFQKMEQRVIRKLYNNPAELIYNISARNYDPASGAVKNERHQFRRTVYVGDPSEIHDAVVDGKNYLKGDLFVIIPFLEIFNSRQALPTDPDTSQSLSDLRPWQVKNCGIDTGEDLLIFGGISYRFIKIAGKDWYGQQPSIYKAQLRGGGTL